MTRSARQPGSVAPDGVFWWGFYTRTNVEEFFEEFLNYLSGGTIDPREYPSANAKVHFLAGMLYAKRCLLILDGLEILQHQEGDQYGLLKSNDLREFLSYFADPKQQSFCLITSRALVLDLMDYTTYTHRDVTRLSQRDGCDLLRKVGVKGDEQSLCRIVTAWDGHALTLSLLGAYLVEQYQGDAAHVHEIPPPTAEEPRYERVHRVLRRYDEHLTGAERAFLTLFSAFRTPVEESAFQKVFRQTFEVSKTSKVSGREKPSRSPRPRRFELAAPIAALSDAEFETMLRRLLTYRIVHYDPQTKAYTTHPLINAHYFVQLTAGDRSQAQNAHETIKDYYLEIAGRTPRNPTLDDLLPLIEVVHHACRAGAYDEAIRIKRERIDQVNNYVLCHQLGAYETELALMFEFFPDSEPSQEPQVSDPRAKSWILNEIGLCLMSLGRLSEAVPFYERANQIKLNITKDWHNASSGYINLAELHVALGGLAASVDAAREALTLARRAKDKFEECQSLSHLAFATHLLGDLKKAGEIFQQAEALEKEYGREKGTNELYLYSNRGVFHADHLRRIGDSDYARRVTEANLKICEENRWQDSMSRSHRVLGDLDSESGQHDRSRTHYEEALSIARSISRRDGLIEALLARGRWQARQQQDAPAAFSDLNEALEYAVSGGYRIYEADIRIALAWAHLAETQRLPESGRLRESSLNTATAEAARALQMSLEMGYYWGKLDAEEVLNYTD